MLRQINKILFLLILILDLFSLAFYCLEYSFGLSKGFIPHGERHFYSFILFLPDKRLTFFFFNNYPYIFISQFSMLLCFLIIYKLMNLAISYFIMFPIPFLLIFTVFSQPFSEVQRLTDPTASTLSIDISRDNNILVTGNYDDKTYIYRRQNKTFSLNQTISGNGDVYVTDLTSDGKVLLMVQNSLIQIYKNIDNVFTYSQTIYPNDGSPITYAAAITDDGEYLAFGTRQQNINIFRLNY